MKFRKKKTTKIQWYELQDTRPCRCCMNHFNRLLCDNRTHNTTRSNFFFLQYLMSGSKSTHSHVNYVILPECHYTVSLRQFEFVDEIKKKPCQTNKNQPKNTWISIVIGTRNGCEIIFDQCTVLIFFFANKPNSLFDWNGTKLSMQR